MLLTRPVRFAYSAAASSRTFCGAFGKFALVKMSVGPPLWMGSVGAPSIPKVMVGMLSQPAGRPAAPLVDGRVGQPPATPDADGNGRSAGRFIGPGWWSRHQRRIHPDPRPGVAAAGERVLPVITQARGLGGEPASG